ncbi:hypothetical protein ACE38W_01575 [Chitinophaga sp. Hz27]|uniref:hypothetical protein n=1 Tax=Chitinophaga sp. Hz27 TaxID=3347169 RepID=UPI0035DC7783
MFKYYRFCVIYPFVISLVFIIKEFIQYGGNFFKSYLIVTTLVVGGLAALAYLPVFLLAFEEKQKRTSQNWLYWWIGPITMLLVLCAFFLYWVLSFGFLMLSPYLVGGLIGRKKYKTEYTATIHDPE